MTHRDLCRVAARWALKQGWCHIAACEVNCWDVLAITEPWRRTGYRYTQAPKPRVMIIEVKRTRADLLADLRAAKMLGYEGSATHLALAATDEALGWDRSMRGDRTEEKRVLRELKILGLPEHWGVLRFSWKQTHLFSVRPTRGGGGLDLGPDPDRTLGGFAKTVAVSLSNRVLNPRSPVRG